MLKQKFHFGKVLTSLGLILLLSGSHSLYAQPEPEYYSYVIIGTFKLRSNAERFATVYSGEGLRTNIRQNSYNDLHYVYAFKSGEVENARREVFKIRAKYPVLRDTWLYNGDFKGPHIPSADFVTLAQAQKNVPAKNKEAEEIPVEEVSVEEPQTEVMASKPEEGVYTFYFNAIHATNAKEVTGDIKVFDAERNKLIGTYKTHEKIQLKQPDNGTHRVRFETDIFGFKGAEHIIDLDEIDQLDSRHFSKEDDATVVNFNMVRVLKGDVITMWRVYFYIDAAIMKEESVYQLNQLLDMMRENPNMKVMIHGHTNGNASGEVLHLDMEDKNFFSLSGTHKKARASAKKLSLYRAFTIQQWLVDQGIPEGRMEIRGWGGKKMIYDKHDSQADKNVRVEIEIIEE